MLIYALYVLCFTRQSHLLNIAILYVLNSGLVTDQAVKGGFRLWNVDDAEKIHPAAVAGAEVIEPNLVGNVYGRDKDSDSASIRKGDSGSVGKAEKEDMIERT